MITVRAPGKVVLWGEYAVLEGAPAAGLAVDRHARCSVETSEVWRFSAQGFKAPTAVFERLPPEPPTEEVAILPWHVLRDFPHAQPATIRMDTEAFYRSDSKLGLGSSAALCVALQAALAAHNGMPSDFKRALAAHRRVQGGRGSGIDVAASFYGGCLRFQNGEARPHPNPLHNFCFVWVGKPERTGPKLDRFAAYLAQGGRTALNTLADCSENLFDNPSINGLRNYIAALRALDAAADLGIYSPPHRAAESLAEAHGLAYKPCGAGGGDIGMAVAESPGPIADFASDAAATGLVVLPLRPALVGVSVTVGASRLNALKHRPPYRT